MTGKGFDAFLFAVLAGFFALSVVAGLLVAGIAWIFTTIGTALLIGALVPAGFILYVLGAAIAGMR